MANITIASLLDKKDALKNKKSSIEKVYIDSLEGEITIKEPSRDLCVESFEMAQLGESARADVHIVYNCVIEPNLKDEKLQKEFGCVEPTDIVDIIFKPGEIAAISSHCMEIAGYGRGLKKVDKEIKN